MLLTHDDAQIFRLFPSVMCSGQSFSILFGDFVRIPQEEALVSVSLGMNPHEVQAVVRTGTSL